MKKKNLLLAATILSIGFAQKLEAQCETRIDQITFNKAGSELAAIQPDSGIYTFAWNNGSTDYNTTAINNGLYIVTVSGTMLDGSACTAVDTLVYDSLYFPCGTPMIFQGLDELSVIPQYYDANTTYLWSNGATTQSISGLTSGTTYCVTASHPSGCVVSDCFTYYESGNPGNCAVFFTPFIDPLFPNDLQLIVTYSANIVSQIWDFGDGTTSTLATPTHTYTNNDIYAVCVIATDGAGCTATACDSVGVLPLVNAKTAASGYTLTVVLDENAPTAVKSLSNMSKMNLYPNPASDVILFEAPAGTNMKFDFVVTDLLGKQVMQVKNQGSLTQSISVDQLQEGVYFLNILTNQGKQSIRFVKN